MIDAGSLVIAAQAPLAGVPSAWLIAWLSAWLAVALGLGAARASPRRWLASPLLAVLALAVAVALRLALGRFAPTAPLAGCWWFDCILIGLCGWLAGALSPRPLPPWRLLRGAQLCEAHAARPLLAARRRAAGAQAVTLAGWPLLAADETKHVKLIGTTGTGKTTAIAELLAAALERGDRVVVADPDGGYLARFYDPARGDRILSPFDPRAAGWDLFAELTEPFHADELARALVAEVDGSGREWSGYARTLLAALLGQLAGSPRARLDELYRLVVAAPAAELALLLEGTPAQPFLEPGNERMFGSLRSVAANAVRGLAYLRAQPAPALSVRAWVRDGRGVLFLPYRADQVAASRTLICAWLRLAIFQTLSLAPVADPSARRLWFVVDELDALGTIDGLGDALARLRKFGGRCVLGFQSIGQVSALYGAGTAQTIVENCATTLILRCSASEGGGTARFASRLIGEREVSFEQLSYSSNGPGRGRRSRSRSVQQRTEQAVLTAEIEQLADRTGLLKLASQPHWVRVALPVPA